MSYRDGLLVGPVEGLTLRDIWEYKSDFIDRILCIIFIYESVDTGGDLNPINILYEKYGKQIS